MRWLALVIGVALLAVYGVVTRRGVRNGPFYLVLGLATWVAFWQSGVDPIVAGLIIGLLTCAYPAARQDLEQATDTFRAFREQPTARLAVEAQVVVRSSISPNERLQERYHSWASYLIVPLFALANADIKISTSFLAHAYTSAATLGIMIGYVVGKPVGTAGTAWLVSKLTRGGSRPRSAGARSSAWGRWPASGSRSRCSSPRSPSPAPCSTRPSSASCPGSSSPPGSPGWSSTDWTRLSPRTRLRALLGTAMTVTDLAVPVDPERDHIRGPKKDALITLVEYGDFECPYCGQAEPAVRELVREFGELRFVFRHLPLTEVHPHAQLAAEGAEAAHKQGKFWEMHDMLMDHQGALTFMDLVGYAGDLALDTDKFARRPAQARGRLPGRGGRRLGRPGLRLGHADVLHQRQPLLRRVRPGRAAGGGAHGQGPRRPRRAVIAASRQRRPGRRICDGQ